jgi:hypothetical protein
VDTEWSGQEAAIVRGAAVIRFYAGLNAFLPPARRQVGFPFPTDATTTVKHAIEALGVPHTDVGLILANGESVDFAYRPRSGDRVSVYPAFESLDVEPLQRLRPRLERPPAFLADNHLGRLVRYLRLLGVDVVYGNALDDQLLAQLAHDDGRILLTRDRGLLKRKLVTHGYCVRSHDSREQLFEVLRRYALFDELAPWTRCLRCNGKLKPVEKANVLDRLEPKTKLYFDDFHQCDTCAQVYWQGSHVGELAAIVTEAEQWRQSRLVTAEYRSS